MTSLQGIISLLIISWYSYASGLPGCIPRSYGKDSPLCICNCTYCDQIEEIGQVTNDKMVIYTTSKAGDRMKRTTANRGKAVLLQPTIILNPDTEYQEIFGFGGTVTDTTLRAYDSAKTACTVGHLDDSILRAYYDPGADGIGYTMGRLPIASHDFGPDGFYSYADTENDFDMNSFALAQIDMNLRIPWLQKAINLAKDLKLISSSWSAPWWMKRCNCAAGGLPHERLLKGWPNGFPLVDLDPDDLVQNLTVYGGPDYYHALAKYFIKYLEAYRQNNISIWAMTTQNEPCASYTVSWASQGYLPIIEKLFIEFELGPALANYKAQTGEKVKLFMFDDKRLCDIALWIDTVYGLGGIQNYIDGLAIHYYDSQIPPATLELTNLKYPNLPILQTEASIDYVVNMCKDYFPWVDHSLATYQAPSYGSWTPIICYIDYVIDYLTHWTTGWIDWAMLADTQGGPSFGGMVPLDPMILVNASAGEFYKQPMYYAFGQISKFVIPGSKRIKHTVIGLLGNCTTIAFKRPDGLKVLIAHNTNPKELTVGVGFKGGLLGLPTKTYQLTMPPFSIVTALLKE